MLEKDENQNTIAYESDFIIEVEKLVEEVYERWNHFTRQIETYTKKVLKWVEEVREIVDVFFQTI